MTKKKSKGYRLSAKRLFLTYPRCTVEKALVCQRAQLHWRGDLESVVIAQEKHQDGGLHLHVLIILKNALDTTDPHFADFLVEQHGSYEAVRNLKKTLRYMTKEDENIFTYQITIQDILNGKGSKAGIIARMIQSGSTLEMVDIEFPEFVMMNKKKVEEYVSYTVTKKRKAELPPWKGVSGPPNTSTSRDAPLTAIQRIVKWINENVKKPRVFKQKQLWICSNSNMGKTSLMNLLYSVLNIYDVSLEGSFMDGYADELYDMVVLDEFQGQRKVTWMNKIVQGSHMNVEVKGSMVFKEVNLPFIVLSNFLPQDAWKNVPSVQIDGIYNRFEVVFLNEHLFDNEKNLIIKLV